MLTPVPASFQAQGKLELHVPAKFTPDRPAILFEHVPLSSTLAEHPLASKIPHATPGLSVHPAPDDLQPLTIGDGTYVLGGATDSTGDVQVSTLPTSLDDYLYSDVPQLALRVVTFTDATFVTIRWPHTMTDALGRRALVEAWSAVLRGEEPPPLLGVPESPEASAKAGPDNDPDPMASLGVETTDDKFANDHIEVTGWRKFWFFLRFMVDGWFGKPCLSRTVCIPPAFMARLRKEADATLPQPSPQGNGKGAPDAAENFVSDGDILTAWLSKMACQGALGRRSNRPIAIMNAFNIRGIMKDLFRPGGAYVQNAAFGCLTLVRAQELLSGPLGPTASKIRASLREQANEKQVRGFAQRLRRGFGPDGSGFPPLYGHKDAVLLVFTNWSKGRFFDAIDFSPAVVKVGTPLDGQRSNALGKPLFYVAMKLGNAFMPMRNICNILGKDPAGNYWVTGLLTERAWQAIEKAAVEAGTEASAEAE